MAGGLLHSYNLFKLFVMSYGVILQYYIYQDSKAIYLIIFKRATQKSYLLLSNTDSSPLHSLTLIPPFITYHVTITMTLTYPEVFFYIYI